MDFNDPHNCKVWFETIAEMFDCRITYFDPKRRVVEFDGLKNNQDKLARYIADHLQEWRLI